MKTILCGNVWTWRIATSRYRHAANVKPSDGLEGQSTLLITSSVSGVSARLRRKRCGLVSRGGTNISSGSAVKDQDNVFDCWPIIHLLTRFINKTLKGSLKSLDCL